MAFLLAFAVVWHWMSRREAPFNPENIVADVDGRKITYLEYQAAVNRRLMKNYYRYGVIRAQDTEEAKLGVFRALVNDRMLDIIADEKHVHVTEDEIGKEVEKYHKKLGSPRMFDLAIQMSGYRTEEEFVEDLRYQLLERKLGEAMFHNITVSDKEINDMMPVMHLRQIFFGINPNRSSDQDINSASVKMRERAEMVHRELLNGADFSKLAKKYSQEVFSAAGGDIGWISVQSVKPAFWNAVKNLKPGQITPVFTTSMGMHIVQCIETRSINDPNMVKLRYLANEAVTLRKRQMLFAGWFAGRLRAVDEGDKIKIYDPMLLANRYWITGKLEDAIQQFELAAKREPDNPYYFVNIGQVYIQMGKPTEALKQFQRAIEINPSDGGLRFNLGVAYMNYGDIPKALEELRRASDMTRLDYEMHRRLGAIYTQLGLLKEADLEQERYQHAVELQSSKSAQFGGTEGLPQPLTPTPTAPAGSEPDVQSQAGGESNYQFGRPR